MPQAIVGLELPDLQKALGDGHPAYRARQIYDAVYRRGIADLVQISTLPVKLRKELASRLAVGLPELAAEYTSTDGTRRYLLRLDDQRTVETVLMPEERRDTICISSQVGCPVNCQFCLTALLGLERNLTPGEIVGQVLFVMETHRLASAAGQLNIVMMGMGEPMLNLANVIKATRLLVDPDGMGLSQRRITLSTAGIVPKIEELGREPVRPKLAISLNASTEEQRRELMPITRKYSLRGSAGSGESLPAAAVGKADLRVRAAEGRQRYGRGCASRSEAAGASQCQSEPDRVESGAGHRVRDAGAGAGAIVSVHRAAIDALLCSQASRS